MLFANHVVELREHRARLSTVAARPDAEMRFGGADSEFVEEDIREQGVVVLPCVNDDVIDFRSLGCSIHWCKLDKLRPSADDTEDSHLSILLTQSRWDARPRC